MINTADVTGDDYDPDPLNNTDAATTTVDASADLSLAISAPDTFTVNAQFAYTLTVTNNGPSNATGVVVVDTLPADVSYISDDSGCTIVGQVVTCALGTVLTSSPETVVINVMATTQGTVIHTATVSANEHDPDPGNNSDSANTTI